MVVFLQDEKVILRPLSRQDLEKGYLNWVNDQEVTEFLDVGTFPTTLSDLERFIESDENIKLAIVEKSSGNHIGNIVASKISYIHRKCELGILIGSAECQGKGYGKAAINLLLRHLFERVNLNKVCLGVLAIHANARKLYEKVGFKKEGILKCDVNYKGRFEDVIRYAAFRDEFLK